MASWFNGVPGKDEGGREGARRILRPLLYDAESDRKAREAGRRSCFIDRALESSVDVKVWELAVRRDGSLGLESEGVNIARSGVLGDEKTLAVSLESFAPDIRRLDALFRNPETDDVNDRFD